MGCVLPPHLSPFTDGRFDQTYIPPEERALMDPEFKLTNGACLHFYLRFRTIRSKSNISI